MNTRRAQSRAAVRDQRVWDVITLAVMVSMAAVAWWIGLR